MGLVLSRVDDGTILAANPAFQALSQRDEAGLLGHSCFEMGLWPSMETRDALMQELIAGATVQRREVRFTHPGGRPGWALLSAEIVAEDGADCVLWAIEDATATRLREIALGAALRGPSGLVGQDWFEALVRNLAEGLHVAHAVLMRTRGSGFESVAAWIEGTHAPHFSCEGDGTPCGFVAKQGPLLIAKGLRETWPSPQLESLRAECFAAVPVNARDGRCLGVLAIMDTKPFDHLNVAKEVLELCALGAAAELERAETQRALDAQVERHAAVVSVLSEGVLLFNRDGAIVEWNPAAQKILRLSDAQMRGEAAPPDGWEPVRPDGSPWLQSDRLSLQTLATGEPRRDVVIGIKRPDGVTWTLNSSMPLGVGVDGLPNAVVLSFSDITPQIEALEAARESEERYRSVVTALGEGVLLVTPDLTCVAANESAARIFGTTPAGMTGKMKERGLRMIREDGTDIPPEMLPITRAIATGQPQRDVIMGVSGTGLPMRWVSVSTQPLFKPGAASPHAVVVSFTDITEKRTQAEEKRKLEAQLFHAQKLEALGTLAGGVAHDFNNLLAAIMGNVDVARMDVEPGHPARQPLDETMMAAQRAKELVQRLLAFGRRREQQRHPVLLASVVAEALKLVQSTLPPDVELVSNLGDAPISVIADESQIHQVVMNLCTNAAHAMRASGGKLRVAMREVVADEAMAQRLGLVKTGPHAVLEVSDEGVGMDETTLARIFEPFFTTKSASEGTGLGLAVVHGIVRAHEGAIEAESREGRCTTFRMLLPSVPASKAISEGPVAPPRQEGGHGRSLLFVDDDVAVARAMAKLLERQGWRVSTASTAAEGLKVARGLKGSLSIIVTDYTMPGGSGLDLAKALRAEGHALPVILTTGNDTEIDAADAGSSGVVTVLRKPFDGSTLLAVLAQHALGSA